MVLGGHDKGLIAAYPPNHTGDQDLINAVLAALTGHLHLIYHTIAWQYFPDASQTRGTALIEAAGEQATAQAPLAWLRMENDGGDDGAALTLRLWPGDQHITLGRVDFHG